MRTFSGLQKSELNFNSDAVKIRFFSSDHPLTEKEKSRLIEDIRKMAAEQGVLMLALDSERVCGKRHLISALYHAVRSRDAGLSRSRDLSVDVMRYAAGERQIHVALERVGIRKGTRGIAVIVYAPGMETAGISAALSETLIRYGFTETEEPSVERKRMMEAMEKTALLDLKL